MIGIHQNVSLPLSPSSLVPALTGVWGADKPTAADKLQRIWCDEDGDNWDVALWSTAGQEALRGLRQAAYPGTEILLLAFDMTRAVSLVNLPAWAEEVRDDEPNVAIIVVGTKSDEYDEFWHSTGKGSDGQPLKTIEQMYATAVEVRAQAFICTSATTGYGTLQAAEEGPAVGCKPDTMSFVDWYEQYLDCLIMKFGRMIKEGAHMPVLLGFDWPKFKRWQERVAIVLGVGSKGRSPHLSNLDKHVIDMIWKFTLANPRTWFTKEHMLPKVCTTAPSPPQERGALSSPTSTPVTRTCDWLVNEGNQADSVQPEPTAPIHCSVKEDSRCSSCILC